MSGFENVPQLPLATNKRASTNDDFSASLDGRQNKRLDKKTTPRLSNEGGSAGLPKTSFPTTGTSNITTTTINTGNGSSLTNEVFDSGATDNLNSYQRAFLSKYGNLPAAQPSGGIKWNKTAGVTTTALLTAKKQQNELSRRGSNNSSSNNNDDDNSNNSNNSNSSSSSSSSINNNQLPTNGTKVEKSKPPQTLVEAAAASARKSDALKASKLAPEKNPALGGGKWTKTEDAQLCAAVKAVGPKNWRRISSEFLMGRRSDVQCLHRWQKVLRPGLVKGPWTTTEDAVIIQSISEGLTKWSEIAERIPGRIGKQCRERWFNHLDPRIKKGPWSEEEDRILIEAQAKLGNRWCEIAKMLPGRSENNVKNRWNSAMRRRYQAKKANEDGSVNPPSPAKRRNRKKKEKKPKKGKKGKKLKSIDRSGPAPIQVNTTGNGASTNYPSPEPWSSPFGFGGHDSTASGIMNTNQEVLMYRQPQHYQDPAIIQGLPVPQTTLSPVSRAYAQRANELQKAQNRSSLTERERQLMHQAFLAGAAARTDGGLHLDPKDGGVQWSFSQGNSSVDIPSIAAFSALGDDGMVHTDIDRRSRGSSSSSSSSSSSNNNIRKIGRSRVPSFGGDGGGGGKTSGSLNNPMEISWGSVGNGDVEILNSAEMADMSLSMLGLSIDGSSNSQRPSKLNTHLHQSRVRSMSPTAAKLAEISGEFKLGRISAEEKERRKEEVLASCGGTRK